jgi:hypothetical protein
MTTNRPPPPSFVAVVGSGFRNKHPGSATLLRRIMIRTCIHKGNLFKKTDFKNDSFSRQFIDVLFGVFGRLLDFYKN